MEASRGKREGHIDRVENPTQHLFAGGPRRVAFGEFGKGNRLSAMDGIGGGQRAKDGVDRVHKSASGAGCRGGLSNGEKIVDKDVDCRHWALEMVEERVGRGHRGVPK